MSINAQNNSYFTTINQKDGLINGDVNCFMQDSDGFMWIGTKYGISIYDGKTFDIYELNNGKKPFTSDISSIESQDKNIWIGTEGDGLFLFNGITREIRPVTFRFNNEDIKNINSIVYWNDSIYLGTDIGLFNTDILSNKIENKAAITTTGISELAVFDNNLAIGTSNSGIIIMDSARNMVKYPFSNSSISALRSFHDSILIIGINSGGLFFIENGQSSVRSLFISDRESSSFPIIDDILIDRTDNIWLGTDGEGLFKIREKNNKLEIIENYRHETNGRNTIVSNAVYTLYEDLIGNIWIGTIWKGLSVLSQSPSNATLVYSDLIGDEPYPVLSVYREKNELWLGTDGNGLNIINLDDNSIKKVHTDLASGFNGKYIQSVFRDSRNIYWLGTFSSGLIKYEKSNERFTNYIHEDDDPFSISYNDVRTILEDNNGDLWIATWGGGLNSYSINTNKFKHILYEERGSISHLSNNITSICFSSDKNGIWIATDDNGLFHFDISSQKYQHMPLKGTSAQSILTLYMDSTNKLWMGTWGNGVIVLDIEARVLVSYSALELISNSRITGIEKDNFGNFWFSSKNGIFKFIESENTLVKYNGLDMLGNKEFHINSSYKDNEGLIYMGGIEGVVMINPANNLDQAIPEIPIITNIDFYRDDFNDNMMKQVVMEKDIELRHNQNFFSISFSSPYFPVSDLNYSVKMSDLNDTWMPTSVNYISYNNLSPGEYEFQVRVSKNNYQWSNPAILRISIPKPIWRRWYSFIVYILIFITLLFLFQKYTRDWEVMKTNLKIESINREKEKEIHNIKYRFFTNISHEIRTPVTLILGAINRILESGSVKANNKNESDVLRTSSRHLLNLINELLDFRRLEGNGIKLRVAEGEFIRFSREVYLSFRTLAETNGISYKFISETDKCDLWFDRDQMEKVTYNLISNAFKYTPSGGSIDVIIDKDDQCAYFKVIDSGQGIDNDKISEIFKRFYQSKNASEIRKSGYGLGLSIAREIVQLHGGEISASNNPDKGMTISIKLPLGNNHFNPDQRLDNFKSSESIESYISASSDSIKISLSDFGNSSILIVEDNITLRDYLKSLFPDVGDVLVASDGQEGLKLAIETIPDLIISDIMMPVMDGVEMTKIIKTSIQTSHIPVILLTARTNLIYKKEGYEVGADDYITKPFNETILRTRVYNILKNRKKLREKLLTDFVSKPREDLDLNTPDQEFITNLTKVIEDNLLSNDISTKLLSNELCMSHSVVYKKIKALTGLSIVEFIRDFKLNRASVLLVKYKMSVSDVCYNIGFSDRRYFSKLFKAKFGITPSEFAKTNNPENRKQ